MANNIYLTVAQQLRLKRLQSGMTLESLAEAADISTSFLAYMESGKKKPSLVTIAKLAKALNVPVHELFKETPAISSLEPAGQQHFNKIITVLHGHTAAEVKLLVASLSALSKELRKQRK